MIQNFGLTTVYLSVYQAVILVFLLSFLFQEYVSSLSSAL